MVVVSTRKGMSSLTTSITVWREAQPCSASDGLMTRSRVVPGVRSAPNCQADSSAPSRSSGVRAARSSTSRWWK